VGLTGLDLFSFDITIVDEPKERSNHPPTILEEEGEGHVI